jgi:hypothetical protein
VVSVVVVVVVVVLPEHAASRTSAATAKARVRFTSILSVCGVVSR